MEYWSIGVLGQDPNSKFYTLLQRSNIPSLQSKELL